ncbi:cyclic nucleotide-binding domain-containing protein [Rappaport israeli]|uniref:cyclic nucleotide-binding domain-containing protein n=1 Tax=Rappaport israeli TaxID=1839807 RepID=UPI00093005E1|nr:cyclic nucleotide-binding domain-containing protein [Rappaport israeli]
MIKEELLHSRLLRESLFFNQLSDAEAREILAHTHISDYQRGEYVLTQGQIPEFMMFLLSGELFTLRSTPEGSEIIIRMLSAGETCMERFYFRLTLPLSWYELLKHQKRYALRQILLHSMLKPTIKSLIIY